MIKFNCWEYFGCGREPGGGRERVTGVCPAALDSRADGTNGGVNGGRICWAIAGTCSGNPSPRTAPAHGVVCSSCEFFRLVREEEGIFDFRSLTEEAAREEGAGPQTQGPPRFH